MITRLALLVAVFSILAVSGYGCFDSGDKEAASTTKDNIATKDSAKSLARQTNNGNFRKLEARAMPERKPSRDLKPLTKQHIEGFIPEKVGNWEGGPLKGQTTSQWSGDNTGSWAERSYTYNNQTITVKMTDVADIKDLNEMISTRNSAKKQAKNAVSNDVELGRTRSVEFYIPDSKESAMYFPIRGRIVAEVTGKDVSKIGITSDFVRQMNSNKFSNGENSGKAVPVERGNKSLYMKNKFKKDMENHRVQDKPGFKHNQHQGKAVKDKPSFKAGHGQQGKAVNKKKNVKVKTSNKKSVKDSVR